MSDTPLMFWRKKKKPVVTSEDLRITLGTHSLSDDLNVTISRFSQDSGDEAIECWCYISEGLVRYGQAEIALLLRRKEDEELPPISYAMLFRVFAQIMANGDRIEPGGYSVVQAPRLPQQGLCYVTAPSSLGLPQQTTLVLLLSKEEALLVQNVGGTRLLTRLGQAARHYPFPPWSERDRTPVATGDEATILARVPLLKAPSATVCLEGKILTLSLPPTIRRKFDQAFGQLPVSAVLGLLTDFDMHANGHQIWQPGQTSLQAIVQSNGTDREITMDNHFSLGGSFLLIIPEQEVNGGRLLEDGFAMMLTDAAHTELRAALLAGNDIDIAAGASDGYSLAVRWESQAGEYAPEAGSSSGHRSPGGDSGDAKHGEGLVAEITATRLYLPDNLLALRIGQDIGPLADYIKVLEKVASRFWQDQGKPEARGVFIAVGVKPGRKSRVWCDPVAGEIPQHTIAALQDALTAVPAIEVRRGPIAFALEVGLWGERPAEFPQFPHAWGGATRMSREPLKVPDGMFGVVWPD